MGTRSAASLLAISSSEALPSINSKVLRRSSPCDAAARDLAFISAERRARRWDVDYKSYRRWETCLSIQIALVPNYFLLI